MSSVGLATVGQGNNGGQSPSASPAYGGGGGGGAGNVGQDGTANYGGNGGIGLQYSISGTPTYYAGGGGGAYVSGGTSGLGGLGGGGSSTQTSPAISGTSNTGGGGGGCGLQGGIGGLGGSGIVIIRYSLMQTLSSPYFNTSNGVQYLSIPQTGTYNIIAAGASGGFAYGTTNVFVANQNMSARSSGYPWLPGGGVIAGTSVNLTQGDLLALVVGQTGSNMDINPPQKNYYLNYPTITTFGAAGGGGATYIFKVSGNNYIPLLIAGGGGGAGTGNNGVNAVLSSQATNSTAPYSSSSTINTIYSGGSVQYVAYPPSAMNANTTIISSQSYGNGTYIASASGSYGAGNEAYRAFDKSGGSGGSGIWNSGGVNGGGYDSSGNPNIGTSTIAGSITYNGEWLQLQLPSPISIQSYSIQCRTDLVNQMPSTFVILGSLDGSTWNFVDSQSGYTWTYGQTITFTLTSPSAYYSYYRYIVTKLNGTYGYISVAEWILTGTAGGTGGSSSSNISSIGGTGGSGFLISGTSMTLSPTIIGFTTIGTTTWTAPAGVTSIQVLVVAGGGGGGSGNNRCGGGGGAGGYIYNSSYTVTPGTKYTVLVGTGGTGGTANIGRNGGNSVFDTLIAIGGGAGSGNYYAPSSGGSAGGGGSDQSAIVSGTSGQGSAGGKGAYNGGFYTAGGGGGAGGAGGSSTTSTASAGGVGIQNSISGNATYYAGGGGAAGQNAGLAGTVAAAALGGGGVGAYSGDGTANPAPGAVNGGNATYYGGGGGGGSTGGAGGNGYQGIVIISYTSSPTSLTGGLSIVNNSTGGNVLATPYPNIFTLGFCAGGFGGGGAGAGIITNSQGGGGGGGGYSGGAGATGGDSTYGGGGGGGGASYDINNAIYIPSLTSNYAITGGNVIQTSNNYTIHTFTSVGTQSFIVPAGLTINAEVLIVAGGGGGGGTGGGGGAGGLVYYSSTPFTAGTYTVTVGAGGIGTYYNATSLTSANSGSNSSITGLTVAIGGGAGGVTGNGQALNGISGGSGGGSSGGSSSTAGSGTAGQGYKGGDTGPNNSPGGGGGAGGAGGNGVGVNTGGAGGPGLRYYISGSPTYYSAGGGGCYALGGTGGGGDGRGIAGVTTSVNATSYGSGGGATNNSSDPAGNGYQGIVIIKYQTPLALRTNMPYYNYGNGFVYISTPNYISPLSNINTVPSIIVNQTDQYNFINTPNLSLNKLYSIVSFPFADGGLCNVIYVQDGLSQGNFQLEYAPLAMFDYKNYGVTMEAWIYPTANSSGPGLFAANSSDNNGGSSWDDWWWGLQGLTPTFYISNGTANGATTFSATANVTLNTWTHIAMTVDSTTSNIRHYINGTKYGDSAWPSSYNPNQYGWRSHALYGKNSQYIGYVYKMRITAGSLYGTSNFTASYDLPWIAGTYYLLRTSPTYNILNTYISGVYKANSYLAGTNNSSTQINGIRIDSLGNIYAAGTYIGNPVIYNLYSTPTSSGYSLPNVSTSRGFLIKWNSAGSYLYSTAISAGSLNSGAGAIAIDSNDNVYFGGSYDSSPTIYNCTAAPNTISSGKTLPTPNTSGRVKSFIIKYNSTGLYLGATALYDGNYDNGVSVLMVDSANNIYAGGGYYGAPTIYNITATVNATSSGNTVPNDPYGYGELYLIKWNSSGVYQACINLPTSGGYTQSGFSGPGPGSLTIDVSGNIYASVFWRGTTATIYNIVSGTPNNSTASVSLPSNSTTGQYGAVIKWNAAGIYQGCMAFNTYSGLAGTVFTDKMGNMYYTGYYNAEQALYHLSGAPNSAQVGLSLPGTGGPLWAFLIKYNSAGTYISSTVLGTSAGNTAGNTVTVDAANNIYWGGYYNGQPTIYNLNIYPPIKYPYNVSTGITLPNASTNYGFIIKFDATGTYVQSSIVPVQAEVLTSITVSNTLFYGGYYLGNPLIYNMTSNIQVSSGISLASSSTNRNAFIINSTR